MSNFTHSRPHECKECVAWRVWKKNNPWAIKSEWLKQYQANIERARERKELRAKGEKRCCDCDRIKKLTEFSFANKERGTYQAYCKTCFEVMRKDWRAGIRKPAKAKIPKITGFNVATLRM